VLHWPASEGLIVFWMMRP